MTPARFCLITTLALAAPGVKIPVRAEIAPMAVYRAARAVGRTIHFSTKTRLATVLK